MLIRKLNKKYKVSLPVDLRRHYHLVADDKIVLIPHHRGYQIIRHGSYKPKDGMTVSVSASNKITIPPQALTKLRVQPGDYIWFEYSDGYYFMHKTRIEPVRGKKV